VSAVSIRIVTYNVHKCRGVDRRTDPLRIAEIVRELTPDIVALQEVIAIESAHPAHDQARVIADHLPEHESHFASNRFHLGAPYGNMTLSRFPVRFWRNYDLTWKHRERRGCLRTDIELPNGAMLHVFNLHLGTGFIERRRQGRMLLSTDFLGDAELIGPRIVVGDFNEWTRGLASRLMSNNFESVDLKAYARFGRTYPGILPMLHLDNFYFDRKLRLEGFSIHRTRKSIVASDHLPLIAEFVVPAD
jgi:endonuclease/exonuclease/phosphatase family metal-dependent hydrolase